MRHLVIVAPRPVEALERFVRQDVEALADAFGAEAVVLPRAGGALGSLFAAPGAAIRALRRLPAAAREGRGMRGAAGDLLRALDLLTGIPRGSVHLHATHANYVAAAADLAGAVAGLPFSFSAHGRDVFADRAGLGARVARAALVVACSRAAAAGLREAAEGMPRAPIATILHGVDLGLFRPETRPPPAVPRILCMARFVPKKGHRVLLEALGILARDGVAFEAVLRGHGPLEREIQAHRAALGLDDRVRIEGVASDAPAPEWFAGGTVYAQPSVPAPDGDVDGIPNALAEAMASGLPPVASEAGGLLELVRDGASGLLVPAGDADALAGALRRLLADPALRQRLSRGARREVENEFDARLWRQRLVEAVRPALDRP